MHPQTQQESHKNHLFLWLTKEDLGYFFAKYMGPYSLPSIRLSLNVCHQICRTWPKCCANIRNSSFPARILFGAHVERECVVKIVWWSFLVGGWLLNANGTESACKYIYICMHPLTSFCKLIFLNLVQSVSVKAVESCMYIKDKNKVWERPKDKMEFGKDNALFDQVSSHDSSFYGRRPKIPPPPKVLIHLETKGELDTWCIICVSNFI